MINIFTQKDGDTITSVDDSPVVFTTQDDSVQMFETEAPSEVISTPESIPVAFTTEVPVVHVFETSPPRGLKGDPGVAGGINVEYPVAHPMSGHRIVILNDVSEAEYASNLNPFDALKVLGMTTSAVISGNIGIQTGGVITEPSWNWILNVPIWLSVDGFMTQTPPVAGFSLIVGFPITATSMFIDIREPFLLGV